MSLHDRMLQHKSSMTAAHETKNQLVTDVNLNHSDQTGLFITGGDPRHLGKLTSRNERRRGEKKKKKKAISTDESVCPMEVNTSDDEGSDDEDKKPSSNSTVNDGKVTSDEVVTRDNKLRRELTYAVTQTRTFDEATEKLVQACRFDIFNDNSKIREPKSRLNIILDMKGKEILSDRLLDAADKLYNATTQNSGNTTSNRKSDKVATRHVDSLLTDYAHKSRNINSNDDAIENGFFIMCAGKADPKNPKKHREENMESPLVDYTLPEDGTDLGTYQVNYNGGKGNGEMRRIIFDKSKYVPITWGGLYTRMNSTKAPQVSPRLYCCCCSIFILQTTCASNLSSLFVSGIDKCSTVSEVLRL